MNFSSSGVISINIDGTNSSTPLTISWALAGGTAVTGYNISYSNTDTQCFTTHTLSLVLLLVRQVTHSQTWRRVLTTVTALLTGGGTDENSATATTLAAGDKVHYVHVCLTSFLIFSLTQYFMFCFEHLSLLL